MEKSTRSAYSFISGWEKARLDVLSCTYELPYIFDHTSMEARQAADAITKDLNRMLRGIWVPDYVLDVTARVKELRPGSTEVVVVVCTILSTTMMFLKDREEIVKELKTISQKVGAIVEIPWVKFRSHILSLFKTQTPTILIQKEELLRLANEYVKKMVTEAEQGLKRRAEEAARRLAEAEEAARRLAEADSTPVRHDIVTRELPRRNYTSKSRGGSA